MLAEAGTFESLRSGRRDELWEVLREARGDAGPLAPRPRAGQEEGPPGQDRFERVLTDYRITGLSVEAHPMGFLRPGLERRGVLSAAGLQRRPAGEAVTVADLAIIRQRPSTARGIMFIILEDETGFANGVVMLDAQERFRLELRVPVLLVEGVVEREDGVVNVRVRRVAPLTIRNQKVSYVSRNFR